MLQQKVEKLASQYQKDIISIRRHLHQYPELSFEEKQTGAYIASQLADMDVEHQHGVADNGVVAMIKGKSPRKKVVALRADIDALPIQESNEVDYKSKHDGIMHACGHDVHTASLLGVAKILNELRGDFEGTVKLIFQPAEERLPGGASIM
ncbi:MAG: amidohydrolase, partial [Bacteroidota bacterium]